MKNIDFKDFGLAFLRIMTSAFLLTHGIPKLLKLASGDFNFGDPLGIGPLPSLVLAVFGEFVCPILIIIGYKTRFATIPPAMVMLVAAFIVHAEDSFGGKEKALLFLVVFVSVALLGPGKYSIDKK